jgi:hypothetical protein
VALGSPRPEAKAVAYAETSLKVHAVYTEAQEALDALGNHQRAATELADWKRRVQEELADREMDLISTERAANPEMSQAAFDRYIKLVIQGDSDMTVARGKVLDLQFKLDEANASVVHTEAHIKILTGRMHELGGLLEFYAATKKSAS